MGELRIQLFGNGALFFGSDRRAAFATRKSKALFAFLVLGRGRIFNRDQVATEFWADLPAPRSRKALNTDFWRISRSLREIGADPTRYLISETDGIGFNTRASHWLDVQVFTDSLSDLPRLDPVSVGTSTIDEITSSVELYQGDLLEGVYDDWCLIERESLRAQHLSALEFLMRYHVERKNWEIALQYGQILIGHDPLMEHVHRAIMRCHYLMGNRPAALKQYSMCARLLRGELDVEPMEETTRMYEAMISVRPRRPELIAQRAAKPLRRTRSSGKTVLEKVDIALANVHTAESWLRDASQQLRDEAAPPDIQVRPPKS